MDAADLHQHARTLMTQAAGLPASAAEILLRRALSASYYAVFHALTSAGARIAAPGDDVPRSQVARAFNHDAMRKVCDACVRSPSKPFPVSMARLNLTAPDQHLIQVADAFGHLQDARYAADYDLSSVINLADVARLLAAADLALGGFQAIQSDPDTQIFLTALLLSDRWTRRG